ncbi:Integrase [Vibrio crassostreae]|nr:Integrase [Vibrio crassostreae]CAK3690230.1 Integrase [Vibrio crassostreae]
MAKSKIAKQSKAVKHVRSNQNVAPLNLDIPYKDAKSTRVKLFDVSHLLYFGTNKENKKIGNRTVFIRTFCKKAHQYVSNGKSAQSVKIYYENLRAYLAFCDALNVDPFSESGYLKYAGNDGELRHRIKMFTPSKRLWEYNHGDELGYKESSVAGSLSSLRTALEWCGLPASDWARHHRGFTGENMPFKGYSNEEEKLLVTRLEALFFTLAPQLIAAKENNTPLPKTLPLVISLGLHEETLQIPTSLEARVTGKSKNGTAVNAGAAFNLTMGAAYHLMCFFTSLNDSNIRQIAHPIDVKTGERDKGLQVVKVSSYKSRSSSEVDALLVGESFDVDKRDGVKFIKLLERLSKLYGNGEDGSELLFTINNHSEVSDTFNIRELNKTLVNKLNLLSPYRAGNLPWFKELFYTYRNQQVIRLKKATIHLGRMAVHKEVQEASKAKARQGATNSAYCILSCYTDLALKGILLPLTYSEIDSDGNVTVSFNYRSGETGYFKVPACDLTLIEDIEQYAKEKADKQPKKYERLLLTRTSRNVPSDWEGISPISASLMKKWSVEPNHYYLSLQSSRWREMSSNQAYAEGGIQAVQSLLQNKRDTIERSYINGLPSLNKVILSQGIEVIENLFNNDLEQAKGAVAKSRGIPMLTYEEGEKKRETNPNGIACDGKQVMIDGKNTQRETNYALGVDLPCAEFDMCHKCQSAKAVNDVDAIYKLISYIDVFKEGLDMFPDSEGDALEKIEAFECTLDRASDGVFDEAMKKFNTQGRHPRVSIDHAILSM